MEDSTNAEPALIADTVAVSAADVRLMMDAYQMRIRHTPQGDEAYERLWQAIRASNGGYARTDGSKLLLPGECRHETTFLKNPPDGWACRDCGAPIDGTGAKR